MTTQHTEHHPELQSPATFPKEEGGIFKNQVIPIALTVVIFAALVGILWLEIIVLNLFTVTDIAVRVQWYDILIGGTIYLKTAIDFAIYIGNLMSKNPGYKSRIAIELGTAAGNAAGTMAILLLWTFFKEVKWLLALMIIIAALVLFKLAEDGLEHAKVEDGKFPRWFRKTVEIFQNVLQRINRVILPVLKYIIPNISMKDTRTLNFWPLLGLAFIVPFILGLDDFAGYVPLFSVINVFGFSIGVFAAHMLLNIMLYISPKRTIKMVKNPVIAFLGSIAFVGLGIWGLTEVVHMIGH